MEQNREPRSTPTHIWSIHLQQRQCPQLAPSSPHSCVLPSLESYGILQAYSAEATHPPTHQAGPRVFALAVLSVRNALLPDTHMPPTFTSFTPLNLNAMFSVRNSRTTQVEIVHPSLSDAPFLLNFPPLHLSPSETPDLSLLYFAYCLSPSPDVSSRRAVMAV